LCPASMTPIRGHFGSNTSLLSICGFMSDVTPNPLEVPSQIVKPGPAPFFLTPLVTQLARSYPFFCPSFAVPPLPPNGRLTSHNIMYFQDGSSFRSSSFLPLFFSCFPPRTFVLPLRVPPPGLCRTTPRPVVSLR